MTLNSWLNALKLDLNASADKPTGVQVAVVYGALGFLLGRVI